MTSLVLISSTGEAHLGTAQSLPKSAGILKLQCQPLPHYLDYQGKLVTARSDYYYVIRNMDQLKECGFQSSACEPYKELGEVILNDNRLILEGLGQVVQENKVLDG